MRVVNPENGLIFEVTLAGKEEFGTKIDEINQMSVKTNVLADSSNDIVLSVRCLRTENSAEVPQILIELYIDGILRNIIQPRTGRGLEPNQWAEARIDQGLVLTATGQPVLKNFRFVELDLDDCKNSKPRM